MFWGLIMEPQRRYSQTVKRAFHISMAALDESTSDDSQTQVICSFDDRNYLLCTLVKGHTPQVALDLNFEIGDQISFATNGKAHVHLTGYLLEEQFIPEEDEEQEEEEDADVTAENEAKTKKKQKKSPPNSPPKKKSKTMELLEAINSNDEDDSDDSDVNMSDLTDEDEEIDTTVLEEAEDEEDEDDNEDEGEEEEDSDENEDVEAEESSSMSEDEEIQKSKNAIENGITNKKEKLKRKQIQDSNTSPKEKPQQQKNEKQKKDKTPAKTPVKGEKTLAKSDKTPAKGDKTPVKSPKQGQEGATPQKRVEGGVIIEDVKLGNGPLAKPGKFVRVYYEGRFKNNNKIFDSTTKGTGFEFRLGRHEVIKGWDVGVAGMKVGGKRRITCPPNMAYGQKGSPPTIPPNSTLVFEVELKNVK